MAKRICPFCREKIQEQATICKHCKSALPILPAKVWYQKPIILLAAILIVLVIIGSMIPKTSTVGQSNKTTVPSSYTPPPLRYPALNLPKFEVAAKYLPSCLAVLVPKNTTEDELKKLVLGFRTARQRNTLSKYIPATTKGGVAGDYAIVWIFVFSEPEWATFDKLKKFINTSELSETDKKFAKEYAKHIKAEYYYSLAGDENGSLGYEDGSAKSQKYQKLF